MRGAGGISVVVLKGLLDCIGFPNTTRLISGERLNASSVMSHTDAPSSIVRMSCARCARSVTRSQVENGAVNGETQSRQQRPGAKESGHRKSVRRGKLQDKRRRYAAARPSSRRFAEENCRRCGEGNASNETVMSSAAQAETFLSGLTGHDDWGMVRVAGRRFSEAEREGRSSTDISVRATLARRRICCATCVRPHASAPDSACRAYSPR